MLGDLPAPRRIEAATIASLAGRRDVAVLDTRPRHAFFAGHLQGAIHADLDNEFTAIAGSYVDEDTPVYLVVEDARVTEAVRALVRVGLDRVIGYLTPQMLESFAGSAGSLARTKTIDMATMETMRVAGKGRVLDVRGAGEFEADHVPGAIHIPHTRIAAKHNELPKGVDLLVHCSTGVRTASAVSMLERLGYEVLAVDDRFAAYRQLPVARGSRRVASAAWRG